MKSCAKRSLACFPICSASSLLLISRFIDFSHSFQSPGGNRSASSPFSAYSGCEPLFDAMIADHIAIYSNKDSEAASGTIDGNIPTWHWAIIFVILR